MSKKQRPTTPATGSQASVSGLEREVFPFTFTLENVPDDHELVANRLFECGCDDAFLHAVDGRIFLDFDREQTDLWQAIASALQCVEACGLGIRVTHVAPPGEDTIGVFNAWLQVRDKTDRLPR